MNFFLLEQNFHILCLIFMSLGTLAHLAHFHHNKTMFTVYDPGLFNKGQGHRQRSDGEFVSEAYFPQLLLGLSLDTSVHHNKTMCHIYDPDLYIQDQGLRPKSS